MTEKSVQKTKLSTGKYGRNSGENSSHHTGNKRTLKPVQPSPWDTTPREHQHTQRNRESPSMNLTYQKSSQHQKTMITRLKVAKVPSYVVCENILLSTLS